MLIQIKKIALAVAAIFFAMGVIHTALAQSIFEAKMEQETDNLTKNSVIGEYSRSRYETELEFFYGPEESEVEIKSTKSYSTFSYNYQDDRCRFKGVVTSGPTLVQSYPYYLDVYHFEFSGIATVTTLENPEPADISVSGEIWLRDYHYSGSIDTVRADFDNCGATYLYTYATVEIE